jgi:hypothetical protein
MSYSVVFSTLTLALSLRERGLIVFSPSPCELRKKGWIVFFSFSLREKVGMRVVLELFFFRRTR